MKIILSIEGERWEIVQRRTRGPDAWEATHEDYSGDGGYIVGESLAEIVPLILEYHEEKAEKERALRDGDLP